MQRRSFGLNWRIAVAFVLIFALAFGAVLHSRTSRGPHPGVGEASQAEKDCEAAKKANGGKEIKECKNLATLTLEDPVALYTFVLTAATILLFVATSGLWYMAVLQKSDTREAIAAARNSADAARRSADLAAEAIAQSREALVASERAWLSIKVELGSGLSWKAGEGRFVLRATCVNVGASPARNVDCRLEAFCIAFNHNFVGEMDRMRDAIRLVVEANPKLGDSIFPGGDRVFASNIPIDANSLAQHEEDVAGFGVELTDKITDYITLFYVCAVGYKTALDDKGRTTVTSGRLYALREGEDDGRPVAFIRGVDTPGNRMVIDRTFMSETAD